ncbi:MAG: V-type ATPase subunit, partial [Clostridia bacterium]|nr:V-type ATPase subunit [Clostridia bacterium]
LEACKDNAQLRIFKQDRYDMFSVAPVAGYYIAKKTELKAVRMIAVLLKINADKSLIKERLREFYA